jgi:hypothetical protein
MKHRLDLPLLVLILTLAPTALASSTWYVNGINGNDNNDCKSPQTACKTIGHAISLASSGDSIMVAAATYTENLTIGFSLKVVGSGASTTIIDGGQTGSVVTISNSSAHVTLSRVTIRNGSGHAVGGGIYNTAALTVNNSTISGNIAADGGGIYNTGTLAINKGTVSGNIAAVGGGIGNYGTVTINNSTLRGNTAQHGTRGGGAGGGIYNGRTVMINNSTLNGNSADNDGGGIYNNTGTVTINNSTLSGNSAQGGGGIYNYPNAGTAMLRNSIVANSSSGGNCSGTMTSNGYNLSSDNTCNFNNTGDLNDTNPVLGPLQNNGGPTQTMALLPGSPAIDAGNPGGCTNGNGHLLKTDQRGAPRPDKEDTGGCDMGAYERQSD